MKSHSIHCLSTSSFPPVLLSAKKNSSDGRGISGLKSRKLYFTEETDSSCQGSGQDNKKKSEEKVFVKHLY